MTTNGNKIELTPEHYVLLHDLTVRTGTLPEEILSNALRQYNPAPQANLPQAGCVERESLYDRLQSKNLIGCLKDGPSDLSTNPKYMEGFGES